MELKTEGIDLFLNELETHYKISKDLKNEIIGFIQNSDCKKIEFSDFKIGALGLALHDGVLINKKVLTNSLEFILFVIFHEISHQYQFKKYGDVVMYNCYLGDISDIDSANYMKYTEEVADKLANKKIVDLQKKQLINTQFKSPELYKHISFQKILNMVTHFKSDMKKNNINSSEKVSRYFYNSVRV
jgi:hypothetical protein